MLGKSEFFSSFIEIEKRPEFSPDQEISPDNFKELVGEYRLDEDVICQVRTKKVFAIRNIRLVGSVSP